MQANMMVVKFTEEIRDTQKKGPRKAQKFLRRGFRFTIARTDRESSFFHSSLLRFCSVGYSENSCDPISYGPFFCVVVLPCRAIFLRLNLCFVYAEVVTRVDLNGRRGKISRSLTIRRSLAILLGKSVIILRRISRLAFVCTTCAYNQSKYRQLNLRSIKFSIELDRLDGFSCTKTRVSDRF